VNKFLAGVVLASMLAISGLQAQSDIGLGQCVMTAPAVRQQAAVSAPITAVCSVGNTAMERASSRSYSLSEYT